QRFTWLPGFYRTFATGEHAVLCLVRDRRWGYMAQWPPDEPGMWYAFFEPSVISEVRWGELRFGRNRATALAVAYHLTIPATARKREQIRPEVLYLAVQSEADARRLFADLLQHMPAPAPQP
ncbi:MAG TPA: hypothetical protein VNK95_13635, partial [Caldilineaceae bacterium]|nr:hypothetical protein [Caldilineaceae bacterium]